MNENSINDFHSLWLSVVLCVSLWSNKNVQKLTQSCTEDHRGPQRQICLCFYETLNYPPYVLTLLKF
jgi:hypothetical protein